MKCNLEFDDSFFADSRADKYSNIYFFLETSLTRLEPVFRIPPDRHVNMAIARSPSSIATDLDSRKQHLRHPALPGSVFTECCLDLLLGVSKPLSSQHRRESLMVRPMGVPYISTDRSAYCNLLRIKGF